MNGLYALKPWYAARLAAPRALLIRYDVHPTTVSCAGVAAAGVGAAALAALPPGPVAAVAVGAAMASRLACANLDGGIARATGRVTAWGACVNELSDRLADLLVVAALAAHAELGLVAVAALGATLPSWVALAGAAAGGRRLQGGPLGKTERCAVAVAVALVGYAGIACLVLAAGGLLTAVVRAARLRRMLRTSR